MFRRTLLALALWTAALGACRGPYPPTHPESALPAEPRAAIGNPVVWIWTGGLEPRTIRVRARTARAPESVVFHLSREDPPAGDGGPSRRVEGRILDEVASAELTGLDPGTAYVLEAEIDGEVDDVLRARFRTPLEGPQSFRIALASCARTGSNGRVFDVVREQDPLFFLHLGDLHYLNVHSSDPDDYRDAYDAVLASPAQSRLYRSVPLEYVWDDHDFGGNNSDSTQAGRDAVARVYRERVPHRPLAEAGATGSIYRSFVVGRLRFVVTDARGARDPRDRPDTPEKTMLGEAQKAWWRGEVEAAAVAGQVVVWVNTVPWISDPWERSDDWGGYTHERAELAAFLEPLLDSGELPGLVMLSGDAHMLAFDDGRHNTYGPSGRPLFPILHAAALDRRGSIKGGPYSEGPHPGGGQFGLMEVVDEGGDELVLRLSGRTWSDVEVFSHEVRFGMPLLDGGRGSGSGLPRGRMAR